jgi:hypothetical protein
MSNKINVYIVNRNLLTTLNQTVEFLLKESRVEVIIFDQASTYSPLLDYYKSCGVTVVYSNTNGGPNSIWGETLRPYFNNNHYIITDSDCDYTDVPSDWLDVMLNVLEDHEVNKVGFSLYINDLPNNKLSEDIVSWESKYWIDKNQHGWIADLDSTFSLYRYNTGFSYNAIRLDYPYTIKHVPWYLESLDDEWRYYIDNVTGMSTWGCKLRNMIS